MKQAVSLVLSSGGARGVAHIGVIEEIKRQGFEIKSIAGSSIGALVGGIYASGNLEVYRDWMCRLDKKAVFNLVDFTISTNGIVKGSKVIAALKKIVPDINIEDLPISYTAVATDIKNKKEVVFEKGSLYEAIRASISIPTVLIPFMLEEMVLIDGGVLNPLPLNRVKRSKNDLLIAVDLNAPFSFDDKAARNASSISEENESAIVSFIRKKGVQFFPKTRGNQLNYYSLLTQSVSLMIQQISAMTIEMYQPDILIRIPKDSYGTFDFYKSTEIIKAGELSTQKALYEFHEKRLSQKKS
jgi:NTE family protein